MDAGRSQVWMKFLLYRDKTFCHKIAKTFLDSDNILMAEMVNLIGENLGTYQNIYRNTKFLFKTVIILAVLGVKQGSSASCIVLYCM